MNKKNATADFGWANTEVLKMRREQRKKIKIFRELYQPSRPLVKTDKA